MRAMTALWCDSGVSQCWEWNHRPSLNLCRLLTNTHAHTDLCQIHTNTQIEKKRKKESESNATISEDFLSNFKSVDCQTDWLCMYACMIKSLLVPSRIIYWLVLCQQQYTVFFTLALHLGSQAFPSQVLYSVNKKTTTISTECGQSDKVCIAPWHKHQSYIL